MPKFVDYQGRPVLRPAFFLCALLLAMPGFADWQLDSHTLLAAEPQSWHSYIGDWNEPLQSGSDAVLYSSTELSHTLRSRPRSAPIRLGLRYQRYAILQSNSNTAYLYWTIKNQGTLPDGRYATFLKAQELIAQGLVLSSSWELPDMNQNHGLLLSWSAALLRARSPLEGVISGQVLQQGDTSQIDWDINMMYQNDPLFGRPAHYQWGHGLSMDLALTWDIHQHTTLRLSLDNALSAIRFDRLQMTQAQVVGSVENFSRISDQRDSALVNGKESTRHATLRLPVVYVLEAARVFRAASLQVRLRNLEGIWFAQAGFQLPLSKHLAAGVHYDPIWKSISLQLGTKQWQLEWQSDAWDTHNAHRNSLNFRLQLAAN